MVALGNNSSLLERFTEVIREEENYSGANHLYSVAALTNQSGGVVERYRYSTFGERTVLAADGITVRVASLYNQQIGFTGRFFDRESGLYYFRSRYYSGSLGRFIGRDPWNKNGNAPIEGDGYRDGTSLYNAYFIPNLADPMGTFKLDVHRAMTEAAFAEMPECGCCLAVAAYRERLLAGLISGNLGVDIAIRGRTLQGHFGDMQYMHSMANTGQTAAEVLGLATAWVAERGELSKYAYEQDQQTHDCCEDRKSGWRRRSAQQQFWHSECYSLGLTLGEALHTIQDSFSRSHTQRQGGAGPIQVIGNYNKQNHTDHGKFDHEVSPEAIDWSKKFLKAALCNEGSPEMIAGQVFQAAPDVHVGDLNGIGHK